MSRDKSIAHSLMPWAGLLGAALGAGLAHQIGSDTIMTDCPTSSPAAVLLACAFGMLIVAAGAFASWQIARRKSEEPAHRLIAFVSVGVSGLALFAILLPIIASLVIPICFA